jgi:polysaccharide pyruvyl transferase CsaB
MKVLISGYYGFGNVGDEAVLEAIVQGLRRRDPAIGITVLSAAPGWTAEFTRVRAVHRARPFSLLAALREADVLISGGGTLFQDVTSRQSIFYYLGIVALAKLLRKKAVVFAQGFGPINGWFSRLIARVVLDRCDLITLRDDDSLAGLKNLGIKRPPIEVTADPTALLTEFNRAEGRALLGLEGVNFERPIVGVALRGVPGSPELEEMVCRTLAENLDRLITDQRRQPVFLLFQCPEDLKQANRVLHWMRQKGQVVFRVCRPAEMLSIIANLDLVIGLRLHALIFAALNAVPLIGLSYDPKVRSFAGSIGQPCLELNDVGGLRAMIDKTIISAAQVTKELTEARERVRAAAERNFDLFFSTIARGGKR